MDPDVPLLIPDVNPDHTALIPMQKARHGWDRGFIVTNPNCTTTHLVCALKPLHDAFGLAAVNVVSMQAISGAGYPGVSAMDILDNVIPYIGGEEEKVETEPRKLLGSAGGRTASRWPTSSSAPSATASQCATATWKRSRSSSTGGRALEEVAAALTGYRGEPQRLGLPSAPDPAIILHTEADRPQPRMDRLAGNGMATSVGPPAARSAVRLQVHRAGPQHDPRRRGWRALEWGVVVSAGVLGKRET